MTFFWLFISFVCFFIELGHPGLFYFLSMGFGALLAFFTSYLTRSLAFQMIFFLGGTTFFLYILKKFVQKFMNTNCVATNVDALIGKRARVVKSIEPLKGGQVTINGQIWSARSHSGEVLSVESTVEVLKVVGCHLIVRPNILHREDLS